MSQHSTKTRLCVLLFAIVAHGGGANAHVRSESMSRWQLDEDTVTVTFSVSAREATRIPRAGNLLPLDVALARYLNDRVVVQPGRGNCQLRRPFTPTRSRSGFVQAEANWRCEGPPSSLEIRAFFELAPEHVHFATLRAGDRLEQRMFTEANRVWVMKDPDDLQPGHAKSSTSFGSYVRLGITHIVTGYDHVAFLLALLLICRRVRDIVIAVSGFTIGHSVTLALGVVGIVQPDTPAIEVTIGLTIALVALEYGSRMDRSALHLASLIAISLLVMAFLSIMQIGQLSMLVLLGLAIFSFCYLLLSHDLQGRGSLRVLMTTVFGLVHGLGFAGAFIDSGLPNAQLIALLLGFNLGVEIGQLALIALMLVAFYLLRKRYRARTLVRMNEVVAASLCGLGVFLLIQRTYSPAVVG